MRTADSHTESQRAEKVLDRSQISTSVLSFKGGIKEQCQTWWKINRLRPNVFLLPYWCFAQSYMRGLVRAYILPHCSSLQTKMRGVNCLWKLSYFKKFGLQNGNISKTPESFLLSQVKWCTSVALMQILRAINLLQYLGGLSEAYKVCRFQRIFLWSNIPKHRVWKILFHHLAFSFQVLWRKVIFHSSPGCNYHMEHCVRAWT